MVRCSTARGKSYFLYTSLLFLEYLGFPDKHLSWFFRLACLFWNSSSFHKPSDYLRLSLQSILESIKILQVQISNDENILDFYLSATLPDWGTKSLLTWRLSVQHLFSSLFPKTFFFACFWGSLEVATGTAAQPTRTVSLIRNVAAVTYTGFWLCHPPVVAPRDPVDYESLETPCILRLQGPGALREPRAWWRVQLGEWYPLLFPRRSTLSHGHSPKGLVFGGCPFLFLKMPSHFYIAVNLRPWKAWVQSSPSAESL